MQETKRNAKDQFTLEGEEDEIEDRTRQHYDMLLSQVAVLQKMLNDYQKQMIKSNEEKQ